MNAAEPVIHADNLTFTTQDVESASVELTSYCVQIGYLSTMVRSREYRSTNGKFWLVMANPPTGTYIYDELASNTATYYTCVTRNASVTANITMTGNM
jgi:hypothetical protein